ncbi:uncharacterized protein LOC18434840 isoform X2 [Amborella trichopoda]|uniref:uncharacterized protein LOC18434840 isoform X2 n=1 Tax=Amborella trichopoda TaxID=13333 RepID=UPI0009BF2F49|nr:uncharacterized protein LOC18434840 isoform X2 [Amborella trichopoda]|eukprot:XP_020523169.1 uncharacterized protein LOC18434840 isoform X2 [Amborella trichopoda]
MCLFHVAVVYAHVLEHRGDLSSMGELARGYNGETQEIFYQRGYFHPVEKGTGPLFEGFQRLRLGDGPDFNGSAPTNDNLKQVIKAVEAAEAVINQQEEENKNLRMELQRKGQELEKYKLEAASPPMSTANGSGEGGMMIIHNNPTPTENVSHAPETSSASQHFPQSSNGSGTFRALPDGLAGGDNAGFSHISSPSYRHQKEGQYDPRPKSSDQGLVYIPENMALKIREYEEDIFHSRKQLADYSMREAQLRNEKNVLEKRIAYMRMAFDQQQQDLVDAASKALAYRQDIIKENIRLTYALQASEQERTIYISSLLPLLSDYDLTPPVTDAQSIVSNLKLLIQHLREKLNFSETKMKESQYQLAAWHPDSLNNPNFIPHPPFHSGGEVSHSSHIKRGLEIVPQAAYSAAQMPISPTSNAQTAIIDWEAFGNQYHHSGSKNVGHDNTEPSTFSETRIATAQGLSSVLPPAQNDGHADSLSFKDLASDSEVDGSRQQSEREPAVHWASASAPFNMPAPEDPSSSFTPQLPPVLEEPSSSYSEADDDALPAIRELQIAGDAFPGREIQACGFSTNGTTVCIFQWVRHFQDGTMEYITGADQPIYLVTADDVDAHLAIQCAPMDDRNRKGELVTVFANEQHKITCDPAMQEQIERYFFDGQASFEVSLSAGCLDIWESATLSLKMESYTIKNGSKPRGILISEKFSQNVSVTIPYGQALEFVLFSSDGGEHHLKMTTDSGSSRDTIVLTMRLFIKQAVEKKKRRKKVLFFN